MWPSHRTSICQETYLESHLFHNSTLDQVPGKILSTKLLQKLHRQLSQQVLWYSRIQICMDSSLVINLPDDLIHWDQVRALLFPQSRELTFASQLNFVTRFQFWDCCPLDQEQYWLTFLWSSIELTSDSIPDSERRYPSLSKPTP